MTISRENQDPELTARLLTKDLAVIGSVTCVERFDGWALLEDGVMFGFVSTDNIVYLRAGQRTAERFARLGSAKHTDMPYWTLPESAIEDVAVLRDLAYEAADIAHLALSFAADLAEPVALPISFTRSAPVGPSITTTTAATAALALSMLAT